ncbi:heme-binding protein [Nocardioides marmoriginsengisoli]|uniref:Heme-binding protein n=1 Tax=Nocardioides marmoriginsengisoli TaxID=661483 RepID=A0A3N0CD11_9ACTN|nr:heme-binding protein [Nocardioides marmoriginsengisoli]RNL61308.1 heme-binding protein [Nocardioides marmoriginsengisoli]
MPVTRVMVGFADATRILDAAVAEAGRQGVEVAVVVMDPAGRTVLAGRMDGCSQLCLDAATGKAYTAAGLGVPTSAWELRAGAEPAFAGSMSAVPGFTVLGGGEPILLDGVLIGAVGVSGGTSEQDVRIAVAGLEGQAGSA